MLRKLFARWYEIWRNEPDPATLDTPDDDDGPDGEPLPDEASEEDEAAVAARYARRRQRYQDRENALAAGLVLAGGLDGFEAVYAVQGMILAGIHHDAVRQAWGDQLN